MGGGRRYGFFGPSERADNIRWEREHAKCLLTEQQQRIQGQINYLNNEYKPRLTDMLKRNTEAYNLSKKNLKREYLSVFDQINEAARRNEVYTMMQVAANSQNGNEDVVSLLLARNTAPLSRSIDKNQGEFEVQNMGLDNKMQEVKNAYDNKMHEVEEAIKDGEMSIRQLEWEKARVQSEADAAIAKAKKVNVLSTITTVAGIATAFVGGSILSLSTGGFGLGLGFGSAIALGGVAGVGAYALGAKLTDNYGMDAVGSVGGMLSGLVGAESPISKFVGLATNPASTMGAFDFTKGGFSAGKKLMDGLKSGIKGLTSESDLPLAKAGEVRRLGGRAENYLNFESEDYSPLSKSSVSNGNFDLLKGLASA